MSRVTNWLFFILLLSAVFGATAHAATTRTAASCSKADVQSVVTASANGDTVVIPAQSCTWTGAGGVTVPAGRGITITGTGTPNSTPSTYTPHASCSGTVITDQLSSGSLFRMNPTYGNSLSRLSCMRLQATIPGTGYTNPISVNGTCTASGCPNFRMDNLTIPGNWSQVSLPDHAIAFVSNLFGVADHNLVGDTAPSGEYIDFLNIGHGKWQGVGEYGDKSWASPTTMGTEQTFFLENNTFKWILATDTDIPDSTGGGARFTCRFNIFDSIHAFGACSGHGTDTTGRARGVRHFEFYYNTGVCRDNSSGCASLVPGRSGVGMVFSNTVTNAGGGFAKGVTDLNPQRTWRGSAPWGYCGGVSVWDTNDGVTYYSGTIGSVSQSGGWIITDSGSPGWTTNQWAPTGAVYSFYDVTGGFTYALASNTANALTTQFNFGQGGTPAAGHSYQIRRSTVCMDQATRGGGVLLSGPTPTPSGPVNQAIEGIYEAANPLPVTAGYTIGSSFGSIINNRDFFVESVNQAAQTSPTSPFNGTGSATRAAGHGTLANLPPTCTTGVGYWATDQGSWNQSGSGEQGQLYICTSTNNWTLSYTPYVYPHPLISGGGSPPIAPAAPTILQVK